MNRIGLLFLLWFHIAAGSDRQSEFQYHYQQAIEAYKSKNYPLMIRHLTSADSLRPNTFAVVYNLAAACALHGEVREAAYHLRRSFWLKADTAFASDSDFVALHSDVVWESLRVEVRALAEPVVETSRSFTLPDVSFHPEGITYDDSSQSFFVGSIRSGRIARIRNGVADMKWAEVSYSAMGMKVDASRKTLWIATTAMPELVGFHDSLRGRAEIVQIDISTGRVRQRYSAAGSHVFGDLVVLSDGNVFITDSEEPAIYRISGGSLQRWMTLPQAWNLQGITATPDDRYLFVADYISGMYRIDVSTRRVDAVVCQPHAVLRGIDGLYYRNRSLIAIHNGTQPFRITQLHFDPTGLRFDGVDILARGGPDLNEPTHGVVVGHRFFFIANSPWGAYDATGRWNPDRAQVPLIMSVEFK